MPTRGEGGLLRRLFDLAPDGMLVTRLRDGRIVMANVSCSRILGCEHSDLFARTTEEIGLWPTGEREAFVRRIRTEPSLPPREVRLDTPNGTCWLEVSEELMTMGGREHVLATLHDITDRKHVEQELRAERDHYAALVATLQTGYYVIGADGRVLDVNERFCEMVGMSRAEVLEVEVPGPWWPPEHRADVVAARKNVLKVGRAEFDWTLQNRDGRRFVCHVTSALMHDADGNASGIVVTVRERP